MLLAFSPNSLAKEKLPTPEIEVTQIVRVQHKKTKLGFDIVEFQEKLNLKFLNNDGYTTALRFKDFNYDSILTQGHLPGDYIVRLSLRYSKIGFVSSDYGSTSFLLQVVEDIGGSPKFIPSKILDIRVFKDTWIVMFERKIWREYQFEYTYDGENWRDLTFVPAYSHSSVSWLSIDLETTKKEIAKRTGSLMIRFRENNTD